MRCVMSEANIHHLAASCRGPVVRRTNPYYPVISEISTSGRQSGSADFDRFLSPPDVFFPRNGI